ncbi:MAG: ParB/RepB/Spo0J family partition protein [Acidobacteria bacterium]|nr:ParB/RepB/Spo0J family partition protein [Acidobacteriota bacterium]
MADKRPALGRGLDALIGDALGTSTPSTQAPLEIDIDRISPNHYQPRAHADESRIDELARSIKSSGLIQPIVVRRVGNAYQIIAGERRWRAAQRAGLLKVPVTLRDVPEGQEQKLLELALVENLQREDLNPIEEAFAYKRLVDEFDLTQDEVAAAVGKDRSTVANLLRLLKLPQDVRDEVSANNLSMGHARALLALEKEQDQRNLAREIVARGWSVRETEQMVTRALTKAKGGSAEKNGVAPTLDVHTRAAQDKLRLTIGTKVDIVRKGMGGEIRIAFKNEDELIRVYEILVGNR